MLDKYNIDVKGFFKLFSEASTKGDTEVITT